jgi:hypothetical protein
MSRSLLRPSSVACTASSATASVVTDEVAGGFAVVAPLTAAPGCVAFQAQQPVAGIGEVPDVAPAQPAGGHVGYCETDSIAWA